MIRKIALAALAFLAGLATSNATAEVEVGVLLVNDFGTASPRHDDLYTAGLAVSVGAGRLEFALTENLFTDELNVVRFDETWVLAAGALPIHGPWVVALDGGVVHVGEGLLGASFQNSVHDIIGASEVNLPYVSDAEWYAVLGIVAGRPWYDGDRLTAAVQLEARQAYGFKGDSLATVRVDWRPRPNITFYALAGPRYSETELAALKPWVRGLAPTGAIGLRYKSLLDASYRYNDFGTEDHHWRVRLTWRF